MIYHSGPTVYVKNIRLPLEGISFEEVQVTDLGVNRLRRLLRKKMGWGDFVVFSVVQKALHRNINERPKDGQMFSDSGEKRLEGVLERYKTHFRYTLPVVLPPQREIDHEIEITSDGKAPRKGLYKFSPVDLLAIRDHIIDLLKKKKIGRTKSPYVAFLFFVKHKGNIRAVVDYMELNLR